MPGCRGKLKAHVLDIIMHPHLQSYSVNIQYISQSMHACIIAITVFMFGLHSVLCFFQFVWLSYGCPCMSLQILHSMNVMLCDERILLFDPWMDWEKRTQTRKNKIFKQGIGIAEKSQETRRDRWDGNVNHNPYFDFVIPKHFNGVKIGICGLHYHPSNPFLFHGFFSDPYSLFENFIFSTF